MCTALQTNSYTKGVKNMQQINVTESRHCTFTFFDQDVETMLFGGDGEKLEEYELELMVLKLWNMQDKNMLSSIGMELAQA